MAKVYIDSSGDVSSNVQCLTDSGVTAVGRYYSYGARGKVLTRTEAERLIANNISIWTVFQYWNNKPIWFSYDLGSKDAKRALYCARHIVGQPEGAAIYFSIDYDETGQCFDSNIVPYFQAINNVFKNPDGSHAFKVGVYGNGLVCRKLKQAGLVSYSWLSNSRAYTEHDAYLRSNQWSIAQNYGAPPVCGFPTDTDFVNSDDFGQFDKLDDLPAPALELGAAFAASSSDGLKIPDLIALGSNPDSIKEIQDIAAKTMAANGYGYTMHNACAATLSAFLQQAGIDVRTTLGAGALANRLLAREWRKIQVGAQQAGDVCLAKEAAHIFLVVKRIDDDEMTIADNQSPEPHERYASGHGKTPADYFLRASTQAELVAASSSTQAQRATSEFDETFFPSGDEKTDAMQEPYAESETSSGEGEPAGDGSKMQVWEDDPESAVLVRRPAPDLSKRPLAFSFDQPAPPAQVYQPGSAEFRYWTAAEALRRGADFWAPLMPNAPNAVWQLGDTLPVILDEGEDLNAYYDRKALNFFHGQGVGGTVYSGASPDVACHEMGHAILDSIKPQLFDVLSGEVAAFHEGWADISAILAALQLPSLRSAILSDTRGRLYTNSRLSRLAEQLGSAIRLVEPSAVEPDCLRNVVNSWVYQDPTTLPQMGPASQLTSEAHNFSRVFSGAVFEIVAGVLAAQAATPGSPTSDELQAVSIEIAKILVAGVEAAPVAANWYAQAAAAIVAAAGDVNAAYPAIFRAVFVRRSILSMDAAVSAARLKKSAAATTTRAFDDRLAEIAMPAGDYGLDEPILVTAASQARPFIAKSAATLHNGSLEPVSSSTAARAYMDDLFSQGRVDYGELKETATYFHHGRRLCSHHLVRENGAIRLRRRLFDCGFCR